MLNFQSIYWVNSKSIYPLKLLIRLIKNHKFFNKTYCIFHIICQHTINIKFKICFILAMLLAVIWVCRFPRVEQKNNFFNGNFPSEKSWIFEIKREITSECREKKHGN